MKSVGEAMAIGRTFQESLQKALRSLELGYDGFDEQLTHPLSGAATEKLDYELRWPGPDRILYVGDAFRAGWTLQQVFDATKIDPWFLAQIEDLLREETVLKGQGFESLEYSRMRGLKRIAPRLQAGGHLRRGIRDLDGLPLFYL
jgi:carbamoyl-phosphate synthase large subunit